MAVSKLLPSSGSNDFNVAITGADTTITFDKEYAAGAYTITISGGDSSFDLYAYNVDGSLAGYTNSAAFSASIPFTKMVVIGQTAGSLLSFSYKKTYTTTATSNEVTAGPVVTSVSPSALPKVDDTLVVTGKNFASNCTVTFTSANTAYSATAAKSVVRSSATSLIVTRPDNFPTTYSPYTLTVSNPGVTNPTGSNSHILSNSVTAGNAPVWVTGSVLSYVTGTATSFTLSATDADAGSAISYSQVSGTLPTGLTFTSSTGVISGTPSTSQQTVTFRATDSGGNFVDKAIRFNAVPVFTSAAAQRFPQNVAYSFTITTTDDTATARTFALTSGSLPAGLTLSSNGVISGTSNASGVTNFTVTATDGDGGTQSQAMSLEPASIQYSTITASGTWTSPSGLIASVPASVLVVGGGGGCSGGAGAGGSGGGGANNYSVSLTPSTNYSITIGGGGAGGGWYSRGGSGGTTSAFGYSQNGGGAGGPANGGTDNNGAGSGNGFSGGSGNGQLNSGGGVGGGGAGAGGNGGSYGGSTGGNAGAPYVWSAGNGSSYGGGSAGCSYSGSPGTQGTGGAGISASSGSANNTGGTANTGGAAGAAGGGSSSGGPFPTGGSGVIIVKYYA